MWLYYSFVHNIISNTSKQLPTERLNLSNSNIMHFFCTPVVYYGVSAYGVGAVLSHHQLDGSERPMGNQPFRSMGNQPFRPLSVQSGSAEQSASHSSRSGHSDPKQPDHQQAACKLAEGHAKHRKPRELRLRQVHPIYPTQPHIYNQLKHTTYQTNCIEP